MNWDAVSAIAESVGALGVIITLLYLAREMRRSGKATSMHAYQQLLDHISEISKTIISDKEFRALLIQMRDPEFEPDENERMALITVVLMAMRNYAHAFEMYQEGTINASQWSSLAMGLDNGIMNGWFKRSADDVMNGFSQDFQDYVESRISALEGKQL